MSSRVIAVVSANSRADVVFNPGEVNFGSVSAGQSPTQTIRLAVGGNLRVQDNDVMPHQLMMVSGPQASFVGAAMTHMGAQSTVTFPSAGTYVLTTKAGEDYVKGIQTIGADNTLRIKVLVA